MNDRRLARLKQQIKQRLAQVLQRDIADPKLGLVTITRIELDSEFTHCKAYWSVLAGSDKEAAAKRDSASVLSRARGFCQREMAKVLHTRSVPRLEFLFDEGIGAAIRMNTLLRELNEGKSDNSDGNASEDGTSAAESTTQDDSASNEASQDPGDEEHEDQGDNQDKPSSP